MDFIKPTAITDSLFWGANVPETDYQEWDSGTSYAVGDTVIVDTPDIHKIFECLVGTVGGLTPDILNDDCASLTGWTSNDTHGAVSEVSPTGQFRLDTNAGAADNATAQISRVLSSVPNQFTLEIKTYFDALGNYAANDHLYLFYGTTAWALGLVFAADGLQIFKAGAVLGEVGSNIVKYGNTAAWQTWRFQVDKTTPSTATVEVFLKAEGGDFVSQGTVDCDLEGVYLTDKLLSIEQRGYATDNIVSHIDYIKIATGLGKLATTDDTPYGNSDWLEVSATNRWKCFDGTIGNQTRQATPIIMALVPGAIDSVALLNIESTTVDIIEIDNDDNLVTNGTAWAGATGTTQPTGWDKVGTPADYTIDGGMIRITTDAVNEGCSQTIAVSAATEYQLLGKYKNTAGDIAQIAIYDVTHSADILATTDLTSSTVESIFSQVFTTLAGCVSVKISLLGKASGDIVWFDTVILAPTEYSETVTTGISKTYMAKTDLVQKANGIITITVNNSGGTAKVGEIIVGVKTNIGVVEYAPSFGIRNWSEVTVDVWGGRNIVSRGFSKWIKAPIRVLATAMEEVDRLMSIYKDENLVFIFHPTYSTMIAYGKYTDYSQVWAHLDYTICNLEVEGLT